MSAVTSIPSARASSSRPSSFSVCPCKLLNASLMCEICTGKPASRPMATISSMASQNQRSSLRIWLV